MISNFSRSHDHLHFLCTGSHSQSCPLVAVHSSPDLLPEELEEAGVAVGLTLLLLEAALAERLQAEVADQVVGVELGPHGSDAATQNGLLTGLADAAPRLVVVCLA